MKTARITLYIAAAFMLLFAAGHTFGFLSFHPSTTEGQAAWAAMSSAALDPRQPHATYAGFYVGFGLFVTVFFLFEAWLAFFAARLAAREPGTARTLAVALALAQLACLLLSARYFSAPPVVFSTITLALFAFAAWSLRPQAISNPR